VEAREAGLNVKREEVAARARALLPDCESWDQLSAADYRANALAQLNQQRDEAKGNYEAALERSRRQTALKSQEKMLTAELEGLNAEIQRLSKVHSDAEVQIAALRAQENGLREGLPFQTKGEANARLQALTKEGKELRAVIDGHEADLERANKDLSSAQGGLKEKENQLPTQQAEEEQARSSLISALARNGFADVESMQHSLLPMGGENGETWLKNRHQAIIDYQNNFQNTQKRVAELTEQTKNLSYTNLAELNEQLRAAEEKRSAAEGACSRQSSLLSNHRQVRDSVAQAQGELKRTDKAWERLDRLAELATGVSADGGKLSFERYVMGAIFREVLEMANRRLDIMSGGKYELVHTVKGKQSNSVAGLEIEVLDVTTGKQRAANSLSGGESFQVSLSLALGLSDVVQSHAGGIGLDTVFIDEGFGALDGSALDSAITVLNQLTEGNRLVGIISHVDKLEESIVQKLRVRKTAAGSELSVELT
jgi:DNA repair exonuclease SbcCD ATPase subunit